VIVVITSNRFLTTRSGEGLRDFLSSSYDLIEVIDLGDTKLFSAAVLPAVIIARKRSNTKSSTVPQFVRIYEDVDAAPALAREDIFASLESETGRYKVDKKVFKVARGALTFGHTSTQPWRMTSLSESAWADRVERSTRIRLGDLAKVRVGIKTTADSVFIKSTWDDMTDSERPEASLLRPLYTHYEAERWRASQQKEALARVLYTHETAEGKRKAIDISKYPKAKDYFERNRDRLERRTFVIDAGRNWWEIWVPQDPDAWAQPKLIFPDISVEPRFFFDESGAIVNGDCYWLSLPREQIDLLYLIQGCANSRTMVTYHDLAFQNKLYSGRRRFISQYVERYPIPDPESSEAREIVVAVKTILRDRSKQDEMEMRINSLILKAFGLEE
jgi:hypothetical protein